MTMRKAWSWALIVALALVAVPAGAQLPLVPHTVSGSVPPGVSGSVSQAVLVDTNGNVIAATVPVVGGKFEFTNVAHGEYVVQIKDAAGTVLSTSPKFTVKDDDVLVKFTGQAAQGGGGGSATKYVAGGAIAIGVGTAIVVQQNKKDKPPKSGKK